MIEMPDYELILRGYLITFFKLINFIGNDPILSIIIAFMFIRLLKGFFERLKRIF